MKKTQFILPLALVCTFLWGLSYPLVKVGSQVFAADGSIQKLLLFAGLRFLLSGGILVGWNCLRHRKNRGIPLFPGRKTFFPVLILALLLTALHYMLMYIGLANCSGSKSSILKQIGILFVLFSSGLFFPSDRLTARKVLGCAVGFAGIVVCNIPFDASFSLLGEGCVIAASLCSSSGDLYSKKATRDTDPIFLSGWQQLTGGALLTVTGLLLGGTLDAPTPAGIYAFIALVIASVVAYTLWIWLTRQYDVSRLALIKLSIPIFGVVMSAVLLGETLWKWQNWAALVLITAGISLAERKPPKKEASP